LNTSLPQARPPARAERLWELGYRLGQGFNFARPLPAHEVGRLLTAPTVLA
jgi:EAL domain-containing protein (putative c-di-GMP-specific phosphodiesterase class I)